MACWRLADLQTDERRGDAIQRLRWRKGRRRVGEPLGQELVRPRFGPAKLHQRDRASHERRNGQEGEQRDADPAHPPTLLELAEILADQLVLVAAGQTSRQLGDGITKRWIMQGQ